MPLRIKKGVGWWLAGDIFSNKVVERVIVVVFVIIVVAESKSYERNKGGWVQRIILTNFTTSSHSTVNGFEFFVFLKNSKFK